jgi:hypothetical protein
MPIELVQKLQSLEQAQLTVKLCATVKTELPERAWELKRSRVFRNLSSVCPQSRLLCGQTLHLLPFCAKTVRKTPVLR